MRFITALLLFVSMISNVAGGEKIRVVSLSPALSELIYHLGAGDSLVGRSSACDYPAEVKKLPSMGNFAIPSMEKIVGARPDLLVTNTFQENTAKRMLEQCGIKVLLLPLDSIADYQQTVTQLSEALNIPEAGRRESDRVREILEFYRKQPKRENPLKVLFLVWDNPMMTVGSGSFIHEMIELAGGKNITASEKRDFFQANNEWLIRENPDVIFFPGSMGSPRQFLPPPGWSEINAVKNGKIYTDLNEDLFFRMGPRFDQGLKSLFDTLKK